MGFSGSTFFTSQNGAYIVKSVPRHFEHSFFKDDLLVPYAKYVYNNPNSLLIRTTDFLGSKYYTVGTMLGTAPSHHIVMENLLCQKEENCKESPVPEAQDHPAAFPRPNCSRYVLTSVSYFQGRLTT